MPMGTGTEQSFGAGDGKGTTDKSGIEKLWFFYAKHWIYSFEIKRNVEWFFSSFSEVKIKDNTYCMSKKSWPFVCSNLL